MFVAFSFGKPASTFPENALMCGHPPHFITRQRRERHGLLKQRVYSTYMFFEIQGPVVRRRIRAGQMRNRQANQARVQGSKWAPVRVNCSPGALLKWRGNQGTELWECSGHDGRRGARRPDYEG